MSRYFLCVLFMFAAITSLRADEIFYFGANLTGLDVLGGPAVTCPFGVPDMCFSTIGLSSYSSLSMTVDYAGPLVIGSYGTPTSWSFTDGVTTITSADAFHSTGDSFEFNVQPCPDPNFCPGGTNGDYVADWFVSVGTDTPQYEVSFTSNDFGAGETYADLNGNLLLRADIDMPTYWVLVSTPSTVPEPAGLPLLVVALVGAGLVGARARRRRRSDGGPRAADGRRRIATAGGPDDV
jgi:hypothetical protein